MEWKYLQNIDIEKTTGTARTTCPKCSEHRKNKKDKCVKVDFSKGVAYCHHCNESFFKDNEVIHDDKFVLPDQNWKNYTSMDDNLVKWIEGRKIPQYIIQQLRWTQEAAYNPKAKKQQNLLCFNSFEKDVVVNKKYRTGTSKVFIQSAGGKQILYNINSLIGKKKAYIVEGEMDVASLYAIGLGADYGIVSIPSANDNDSYWINSKKYLENIEEFVIATDNDEKGNLVADKISHRLGKYKCKRVLFENKDANGDLIAGVLETTIKRERSYPVSGVSTTDDIRAESIKLYNKGMPETIKPLSPCFNDFNKIFSTMRGHLVTVTGIPSNGKSSFVEWYVLNLVDDHSLKVSLFSPEHHPLSLYQNQLAEKYHGKSSKTDKYGEKMTEGELNEFIDWGMEKVYYLSTEKGLTPTWDWYIDKMREQVYSYGINLFVIDSWTKLLLPNKKNKIDEINNVLIKLTSFSQSHNVIIVLVAHPTKMKKRDDGTYPMPDLYDVSGSADFRNQTHDAFVVHREYDPDRTVVSNLKTKYLFQGELMGESYFTYDKASGRFYPQGKTFEPYKIGERPFTKLSEKKIKDFSEPTNSGNNDSDMFDPNAVPF